MSDTTDNDERPYGDNPAITPIRPNSGHYGQPGLSHEFDSVFHVGERPLRRDEMKDDGGHNTHSESNRRPVAGVRPSASADHYQGSCPGEFESIYDHGLNIRPEVPFSSSPPGELDCPDLQERVSKNKDSTEATLGHFRRMGLDMLRPVYSEQQTFTDQRGWCH